MVDARLVAQIVAKFPEILENPESLKTEAYQEAVKFLGTQLRPGTIPGLPPSLSGIKTESIKLAKSELKRQLGRLSFLDGLL